MEIAVVATVTVVTVVAVAAFVRTATVPVTTGCDIAPDHGEI